jgi:DNA-directed RNA polymerase specialized sigma24 family protein
MGYKQLSDRELIDRFLICKPEQTAIRDELFGRYYQRFDQRIRAVLYTYGLPYSPGEFYYNEIFIDIYQQVFELKKFGTILQKWEIKRGEFASWFLNFVVVNRIKNWLMKLNKTSGRKNIEWLKEKVREEYRILALNEPIGARENGLTLIEVLPAEAEPLYENDRQTIDSTICQLSPVQQLMLKLLFIAYQEVPEQDQTYLAAELNIPVSSVKEELGQICQELKKSPKYEQGEKGELTLACLTQRENDLQWKLKNIESELEALFPDKELPQTDDYSQLLFKNIDQAKQELDQSYHRRQVEEKEYRWKSLFLQYQYIAKQLSKTTWKKTQLAHDYQSGKYFVTPSYKQLSLLLQISEGTVASRISRTISNLKELRDMEENKQKICINKLGDSYWKEEEYVG